VFGLIIIALGLAVIISLIMAEAEAESTHVPFHSPVIPPGFKVRLKHLCMRNRYIGRLLTLRWRLRVMNRHRAHA
jgi:hypothetical protein